MDPFGFGEVPMMQASSMMQPFRRNRTLQTRAYNPMCDVDVIEKKDGSFQVHVDMPGVDPKDLDITVDDDQLIVKAERHCCPADAEYVQRCERKAGQFQRTIRLPPHCDGDKADTKFCNGVLHICFPKKAGTPIKIKLGIREEK